AQRVGRRGRLLDLAFPGREPEPRPSGTVAAVGPSAFAAPTATGSAHAVLGPAGSGRSTTARALTGPDATHVRRAGAADAVRAAGLVVVTSRENPRAAVTEVLDACGARTTLQPLHERGHDGAEVIESMVAELSAERGISPPAVDPGVIDALCTADLPHGLVSV